MLAMAQIETLAIFPLSDVVLLPEATTPLYIFEPRYRQMTRDALEGTRQIGMVTVRPDHVHEMGGNPPIFDVGCLGRIAHSAERPDGTYQIMLLGEQRFRVLEEDPPEGERLYRRARVQLLEHHQLSEGLPREQWGEPSSPEVSGFLIGPADPALTRAKPVAV